METEIQKTVGQEWWPTVGKRAVPVEKETTPGYTVMPRSQTANFIMERADPTLLTQG
jgi:hypothetical protein